MNKLNELLTCPCCGAKDFSEGYIQAKGLAFVRKGNPLRGIIGAILSPTNDIDAVVCNGCGYLMLFARPAKKR